MAKMQNDNKVKFDLKGDGIVAPQIVMPERKKKEEPKAAAKEPVTEPEEIKAEPAEAKAEKKTKKKPELKKRGRKRVRAEVVEKVLFTLDKDVYDYICEQADDHCGGNKTMFVNNHFKELIAKDKKKKSKEEE